MSADISHTTHDITRPTPFSVPPSSGYSPSRRPPEPAPMSRTDIFDSCAVLCYTCNAYAYMHTGCRNCCQCCTVPITSLVCLFRAVLDGSDLFVLRRGFRGCFL